MRQEGKTLNFWVRVSYHVAMSRRPRQPPAFSKISVKNQTVIPHAVRERLKLKPGDMLRYRVTDDGILLDKAAKAVDDPFAAFSEWKSEADEGAYREL
jgi:antitoxin PrlF